jgi:hypothetical protein
MLLVSAGKLSEHLDTPAVRWAAHLAQEVRQQQQEAPVVHDPPHVDEAVLPLVGPGEVLDVHADQRRLRGGSALRQRLQEDLRFKSIPSEMMGRREAEIQAVKAYF